MPPPKVRVDYTTEYSTDAMLPPGSKVVVVDDLVATGRTLLGAQKLADKLGLEVVQLMTLLEVDTLKEARERMLGDIETKLTVLL